MVCQRDPTIGLILCGSRERITAEYALRNLNTPIAVATHQLPETLQAQLPTVEQLEMVLEAAIATEQSTLDQSTPEQPG